MERAEEGLLVECLRCHSTHRVKPEELTEGTTEESRTCSVCGNIVPLRIWTRALESLSSFHELNKAQLKYNECNGGYGFFFAYSAPGFETLNKFMILTGQQENIREEDIRG